MLIPVMQDYYQEGYLPRTELPETTPFFPNCNLALRKDMLAAIGDYDESLQAAEDMDICHRMAHSGARLYFEPQAQVHHAVRKNIPGVIRQWFGYGYWSAFVMKKKVAESKILISFSPACRINDYRQLLCVSSGPFKSLLFINYYLFLLMGLGFGAFAFLQSWYLMSSLILSSLGGYGVWVDLKNPTTRGLNIKSRLIYHAVLSIINLSCILGSFIGGLRNRMLYVYPGL